MTLLETVLSTKRWCRTEGAFTTVVNGFGFFVRCVGYKMWLAGLSKEVTAELLKAHNMQPPTLNIVGLSPASSLFEIPASPELLSAIVMSTYPELSNDLRGSVPPVRHPSKVLGRNASVRPSRRTT